MDELLSMIHEITIEVTKPRIYNRGRTFLLSDAMLKKGRVFTYEHDPDGSNALPVATARPGTGSRLCRAASSGKCAPGQYQIEKTAFRISDRRATSTSRSQNATRRRVDA